MKALLLVLFSSISLLSFSDTGLICPEKFDETTIKGLFNPNYHTEPIEEFNYQQSTKSHIILTEHQFFEVPMLAKYGYKSCENAGDFVCYK